MLSNLFRPAKVHNNINNVERFSIFIFKHCVFFAFHVSYFIRLSEYTTWNDVIGTEIIQFIIYLIYNIYIIYKIINLLQVTKIQMKRET